MENGIKENQNLKNITDQSAPTAAGGVAAPSQQSTSENIEGADRCELGKESCHARNSDEGMAEFVTRHTLITDIDKIEYLTCGIDTLDVGFFVFWGENWEELKKQLDERKSSAQGTDGNLIEIPGVRPHVFYANAKPPNYRYHVRFPDYHCFVSIAQSASQSPNIYVSFTSEAIHFEYSENELIERVVQDIESLGGMVIDHKISRCDLYADFRIPGGLNLDFLNYYKVGKSKHTSQFLNGNSLETYYVGQKSSPIQLRIYNKSEEIKKKGTEERWKIVWFTDDTEDIWRIEAQIRRKVLQDFGVNAIDDLRKRKADLWKYVTCDWFSLRHHDDVNRTRCTVHEFWVKVQSCGQLLGSGVGAKRTYEKKGVPLINWSLNRFINSVMLCAVQLQDYDFDSCLKKIRDRLTPLLNLEEFREKARKKSVESGVLIINGNSGDD